MTAAGDFSERKSAPVRSKRLVMPVLLVGLFTLWATPIFAATAVEGLPPVVSPSVLAERLAAAPGSVVLLDARPAIKAYLAGHVPGAQLVVADSLRSTAGGVPGALFPWETIHLVAHRLGIANDVPVVVYGEESDIDATYVASVLRIAGVKQVSVLDGGFERWTAEKRPVTPRAKAGGALDGDVCAPAGRPRPARRREEGRRGEVRRAPRRAAGRGIQRGAHPRREVAILEEGSRPGGPAERRLLPPRGRRQGRARGRGRDRRDARHRLLQHGAAGLGALLHAPLPPGLSRTSGSTTAPGSSGRSRPGCRRKSRRLPRPDPVIPRAAQRGTPP